MSWLSKSIKKIIPKKLRPAVFLLKAPKAATAPTIDLDAAAKAAAAAEAERIKKKKGYQSTIVTGQLGISSEATTKKNILG